MNTKYNLEKLKQRNLILLECISGSKAYGLDLPTSDLDIRGVFISPKRHYYGLNYDAQVADKKNDVVYYELKRFFDLLAKSNPNILELLNVEPEHMLFKHPLINEIDPSLFLSKKCKETFAGYAHTQIRKAKGLNKKIYNPIDKERKNILHFCYVMNGQGTKPLLKWLAETSRKQEYCGLVKVPHMRDLYGVYYDEKEEFGFKGVMSKEHANEVVLSSIPKELKPVNYLSFNKDGYTKYCKDYKSYWKWVKERNEARYENTITQGKNYDAKNMMHTFRLLDMAIEILRYEKVIVKRPNREELLKIRSGHYSFEALMEMAEEKMERITYWYDRSSLPEEPDKEKIEHLLFEIRENWYEQSGSYHQFSPIEKP